MNETNNVNETAPKKSWVKTALGIGITLVVAIVLFAVFRSPASDEFTGSVREAIVTPDDGGQQLVDTREDPREGIIDVGDLPDGLVDEPPTRDTQGEDALVPSAPDALVTEDTRDEPGTDATLDVDRIEDELIAEVPEVEPGTDGVIESDPAANDLISDTPAIDPDEGAVIDTGSATDGQVFVGDIGDSGDGDVIDIGDSTGGLTTGDEPGDVEFQEFNVGIGDKVLDPPIGGELVIPTELTFGNDKLNTWLVASSEVEITNGTVTSVPDLSGNGNNMVATEGAGPILMTNDPDANRQPYFRFDGVNDLLALAPGAPGGTSERVFVVLRAQNTSSTDPILQFDTPADNATEFSGLTAEPEGLYWLQNNTTVSSAAISVQDPNPDIIRTDMDKFFVAEMFEGKMYINGVVTSWDPQEFFNDPFFKEPPLFENESFTLGTDAGRKAYADADVAEVLMFSNNLTTAELRNLRSYLFIKYSISPDPLSVRGFNLSVDSIPDEPNPISYAFEGNAIAANYETTPTILDVDDARHRIFGAVNLPNLLDLRVSKSLAHQGVLGLRAENLEANESVLISSNRNLNRSFLFNIDIGPDDTLGTDDDRLLDNYDLGDDGIFGTFDDNDGEDGDEGAIGGGGGGDYDIDWGNTANFDDPDGETDSGAEYINRFWSLQTNADDGDVGEIVITLDVDPSLPNDQIFGPGEAGGDFAVPPPNPGDFYYLIFSGDPLNSQPDFNNGFHVQLRDDGLASDLVAGNNVYSARLSSPENYNFFTLGRSDEDLFPGGSGSGNGGSGGLDTAPQIVNMNSADQQAVNAGLIDVEVVIEDQQKENDLQLMVEYDVNGGACDGPWEMATVNSPLAASNGSVNLLNPLQLSFQEGYQIDGISTSNLIKPINQNIINFVWNIGKDRPEGVVGSPECLQFTIRENEPRILGETQAFQINLTKDVIGDGNLCGNGDIDPGETCDDGNFINDDGCSAICVVEDGWQCAGEPSICIEIGGDLCGNGDIDPGENCDDGNTVTEACDYGETSCNDVCTASCLLGSGSGTSYCGDGTEDETNGEQCDDGNAASGDGCSAICQIEGGEPGGEETEVEIVNPDDDEDIDTASPLTVTIVCEPGYTVQISYKDLITDPTSFICPDAGVVDLAIPWDDDVSDGPATITAEQYDDEGNLTSTDEVTVNLFDSTDNVQDDDDTGAFDYDPDFLENYTLPCLEYQRNRQLEFLDVSLNARYADALYALSRVYLPEAGGEFAQFIFSGFDSNIAGITSTFQPRVTAGPELPLIRRDAAKINLIAHCFPIFKFNTLPEGVTYSGKQFPILGDFPSPDMPATDQDVIGTALFLETMEGTLIEREAQAYRPVLTPEMVKLVANANRFLNDGGPLPRDEAKVAGRVPQNAWYYPFYTELAAEGLLDGREDYIYQIGDMRRWQALWLILDAVIERDILDNTGTQQLLNDYSR